jgi:transposase-like protein
VSSAKLTDAAVREIKALVGAVSVSELARRYGVSRGAIQRIMYRGGWKHVA